MVYEIIGSRIVSPFIGTSTYVWTSLIGVILASLSLGYWLGGRVADRYPNAKILASIIFLAGGLVAITVLIKDIALASVASLPAGLEIRSLVASVALFGPASIALGFVTPYAVKLRMNSLDDSARTVGRLYALSTVGSIAGTFAAGFFLVPLVGSVRTLYLLSGVLIAVSLLLAPLALSRSSIGIIALLALSIVGNEASSYFAWKSVELRDIDTEYSRVQVLRTTDDATGRPMRVMATDPYFIQSAVYLDGDDMAVRYGRFYHLIRHFRPGFKRSLMIGGAGYAVPKEYIRTYPDAKIEVVEIDPQMTEIARNYFRLPDDPRLTIHHADGRVFLNQSGTGQYDAVFLDAFGSLFSIPHQLTTVESVRHVDRVMNENGVVIMNLGGAIRGDTSKFFQAEIATYREVFPHVFVFKVKPAYPDERTQNLIIVACKSDCDRTPDSSDAQILDLLSHRYTTEFPIDTPILTDDLAPVEYYNSFAQNSYGR